MRPVVRLDLADDLVQQGGVDLAEFLEPEREGLGGDTEAPLELADEIERPFAFPDVKEIDEGGNRDGRHQQGAREGADEGRGPVLRPLGFSWVC